MENLGWGLQITALGMGLVFGLLALLWGLLTLMLRLDREPAAPAAAQPAAGGAAPGMDPQLVAAVTVAVLAHRDLRRQEAAPAMRSFSPGSLLHASRWLASGRARQNQSWRRGGR